ncbi:hypothetical protein OBBRIDRAFT_161393 [Obba rivulosa]|uniref:Uncharacterized protein n=1 Tax=Obba rivulosa TaxID=1052685 RepID=A0A8E2AS47_9APHY|nr:hypothetical protein OBBRIDRAFT_161393 [Obba rivulosa]
MTSPTWTNTRLDDLDSVSADFKKQLRQQLQHPRDFREGWKVLEMPHSWTEQLPEYAPAVLCDDLDSLLERLYMKHIEDYLVNVDDSDLEARSPYGLSPTFCLSSDRYNPNHQLTNH